MSEEVQSQTRNRGKPVFLNHKGYEINESKIRTAVLNNIRRIGNFGVTSKYYTFLNKKNLYEIKDGDFKVSLCSYGKKYVLFLTTIEDKRYSVLINKKNEVMVHCKYNFQHQLYSGTLFDGELVKNEDNKWVFIINDVAYENGVNVITRSFEERQTIINDIIENKYLKNGENMTHIMKKLYFGYEHLEDLSTRYRGSLSYKCSGIYFRNVFNYSDNYLYVFPECRTDHQVLTKVEETTTTNNSNTNNREDLVDDIFGEVDVINTNRVNEDTTTNVKVDNKKNTYFAEKKTCKFLAKPTTKPDVYELYCKSFDRHIEKYAYAGIPNMQTSKLMKGLFKNYVDEVDLTTLIRERKAIFVECEYKKKFKKWIPLREATGMDHHVQINEVQISVNNMNDESESDSGSESD